MDRLTTKEREKYNKLQAKYKRIQREEAKFWKEVDRRVIEVKQRLNIPISEYDEKLCEAAEMYGITVPELINYISSEESVNRYKEEKRMEDHFYQVRKRIEEACLDVELISRSELLPFLYNIPDVSEQNIEEVCNQFNFYDHAVNMVKHLTDKTDVYVLTPRLLYEHLTKLHGFTDEEVRYALQVSKQQIHLHAEAFSDVLVAEVTLSFLSDEELSRHLQYRITAEWYDEEETAYILKLFSEKI